MNEQDLMKLKTDFEIYKNKIDRLDKEVASQEQRISELEKRSEKTDFQYEQIMKMLDKLTEQTIPELSREIQAIKNKPAERYNTIIASIITACIGAVVGFICSKLFT